MIKMAKESGADCAKFQKNILTQKFNKAALARPYTSYVSIPIYTLSHILQYLIL